nr:glutathione S-transferase family protein [Szabonella alba]
MYELAIGDRSYSSWSLRGWLLFEAFGIPVTTRRVRLYSDDFTALLRDFAPARSVPALRLEDGTVIPDSLAIAEELASRHPLAGIWPQDAKARAVARALAAEMHAAFGALRSHCPMNLRSSYERCDPPEPVLADLARLEQIWGWARAQTGSPGPWLCGEYSAADVFFAPVATRIATYNLPVGPQAAQYVAAHLADPALRRWRAMGRVEGPDQPFYRRDWPQRPWPAAAPLPARAVESGPSVNAACPYSGDPVTHFLEAGGRVWGFCNAFCRDKTAADPEAWPAFMAIYRA